MPKQVLRPRSLLFQPRPTYPYSPGAKGNGLVFTAGQVAWDKTGKLVGIGDVRKQTIQTLRNVVAVLKEGGATPADVLKCTVYLADIRHFQIMNEEFAKVFAKDPPARTTVEARLAEPEMLVEIEAIAWVGRATHRIPVTAVSTSLAQPCHAVCNESVALLELRLAGFPADDVSGSGNCSLGC